MKTVRSLFSLATLDSFAACERPTVSLPLAKAKGDTMPRTEKERVAIASGCRMLNKRQKALLARVPAIYRDQYLVRLASRKLPKLLGVNPKVEKGEAYGYKTFILHLAPSDLSGFNVCPFASVQCRKLCLNSSGQGGMIKGAGTVENLPDCIKAGILSNQVQVARILRTVHFFVNREVFLWQLEKEIRLAIRRTMRAGEAVPVFRLNGTSDLQWESLRMPDGSTILEKFPGHTFYDYTKVPARLGRALPANYSLTFSLAEDNDKAAREHLAGGGNVAVVFSTKKGEALPAMWWGYPVVDGDTTDLRFTDPRNVIIGLRAKGKARGTDTGFVQQV